MRIGHIAGRITPNGRTSQPKMPGIDTAGGGFRAGAAGSKRYGLGQVAPTQGKLANTSGYTMRDNRAQARKAALAKRGGFAI